MRQPQSGFDEPEYFLISPLTTLCRRRGELRLVSGLERRALIIRPEALPA